MLSEKGVHMPPTRHPYPSEFKAEAVRLYLQSGKKLQEIASDLGISTNSLREWLRRAKGNDVSNGKSRTSLNQDEREELKRLQRENRILREEREILKKAAAFFAQETSKTR
jgi:transposase